MPVTDTTSCCDGPSLSLDAALTAAGVGAFQLRLLALFGLVWAADAMQVLAIGFAAPSIAGEFGLPVAQAVQGGTAFFLGMLIGAWGFGRLADRFGRRRVLIGTVLMDALFGLLYAAAPNFSLLLGLRFLVGAAVGGTLPVDYAMMAEFLSATVLFLIIHPRPHTSSYPNDFPAFLSRAVHKRPFTFVPIHVFC
jgi:MFS transporter, putative metabolite:H+ symporter